MNSPRVIELPRRLEPVTRDTFLAGTEAAPRGQAQVIAFVPRDQRAPRRKRPGATAAPPAAA
jgi:hypothetical protein